MTGEYQQILEYTKDFIDNHPFISFFAAYYSVVGSAYLAHKRLLIPLYDRITRTIRLTDDEFDAALELLMAEGLGDTLEGVINSRKIKDPDRILNAKRVIRK